MAIVVCGLSHKTTQLPILEQVAFTTDALPKALQQLSDHEPIHEAVILSTCNRTEIYASVHRFHAAVEAVRRFLSDTSGVDEGRIADGLYTYYDSDAARHLYNVASGVDSMVVGEPQILGQVREAFRAAEQEGAVRRMLHQLFQRALNIGKRARTETAIARHVVSLPQAGARVASDAVGSLEGKRVVVVGAGRMSELAARAAIEGGCTDIVIANRSADRAEALGTQLGGSGVGLDALGDVLLGADVLISATSSEGHVVSCDLLERASRVRRLAVVDLALPRDVEPSARELSGVELFDIEDLRSVVDANAELRKAELPKVATIVDTAVEDFTAWERSLALGPAIESLRGWAESVRAAEMERLVRPGMSADEVERLDRATRAVVNKLLHHPMVRMRDLVRDKDGQVYLEAFQEIFDLD